VLSTKAFIAWMGGVASGLFTAAEVTAAIWRQMAKASSSNATATRRFTGSSTASS
jgi:hypothetical protein